MVVKPLLFAFFVLSACAFSQTPQFTIQDLGSLPNLQSCTATGLSQVGNVTGYCLSSIGSSLLVNPTTHGFLYSNGALTDLNVNALSTPTILPMAVNDSGVVTGAYVTINTVSASLTATPFIVQQDGSVTIPEGQMQGVLPFALNNAGQLAGSVIRVAESSFNLFVNGEAVLYTLASGATSILPAPTGGGAAAFGVNLSGTVAGASIGQNGAVVNPLLWINGKSQSLPQLAAYQQSLAASVNGSGAAAGVAFDINFSQFADPLNQSHAVLFNTDGSATDLGVLPGDKSSLATGINDSGSVVGVSSTKEPDFTVQLYGILNAAQIGYRAFFYTGGKMYDLNMLLKNGTGWTLTYATAINNLGQIAGTGLFQSPTGVEQHGFLLTPVPAVSGPSITGVVGAGLSIPAVTSISPNGLFTIFGSLLASAATGVTQADIVNNQLPTNLGGTCVENGSDKWGLFYVSPGQINALAGDVPSSGTVPVSVITNCGTANEVASPAMNVPVAAASPEFLYFIANANGQNPVAAIQALTGTYVGAPGLIAGATFAPAHAGDILTAFGVAWGATTSTDPIGTLDAVANTLTSPHSLTLGGVTVDPSYVGLTPTFAGLYQLNFTVPSGLAAGNQPLVLTVNGTPSPSGPYITIGN
jgi:uncharacterized protein (TIGR03437 family)